MKVVQINATCGVGSTGKICVGISELLTSADIENYILFSSRTNDYPLGVSCANDRYIKRQALKSKVFGNYGFQSGAATRRMIAELKRIQPDVVHLHNIHGHDCDLEMLFPYFKKTRTRLVWTFHDCWAFTGYCTHFTLAKCGKWKSGCTDCPERKEYSWLFDHSRALFERKRELFQGLDLTIATPSQWLADLVQQSFLKDCPVQVIPNGIDLTVFRPIDSSFRQKHGIENKKLILGVSFDWDFSKGLDVFAALAGRLPEDFQIVLVGTDAASERMLPEGILALRRTQDQRELAEIYTAADVLVNPTREDTFPTVNLEALACGTPVVTFRTGGSPETIDETCGSVVECDDVDALEQEILRVCTEKPFSEARCVARARKFERNQRFKEYLELYERIVTSGTEGY